MIAEDSQVLRAESLFLLRTALITYRRPVSLSLDKTLEVWLYEENVVRNSFEYRFSLFFLLFLR